MHIVLMDGADPRFLGGSARARNVRVATRAGATVDGSTPAPAATSMVMLVPSTVALTLPLFDDLSMVEPTVDGTATRLLSPDGAWIVVGSWSAIEPLARDRVHVRLALPTQAVAGHLLLNLSTRSGRRHATRIVLRATAKASDGWISRHVNRPVSRACSRVALSIGMSATAASVATLGVGLACAWCAAQPGYLPLVVTGILFHLASVLDGVDGEIARSTLTESAAGARVDTVVDQLTYVACFGGFMIGWVREGGGRAVAVYAAITVMALVLSLLRAGRFVSVHGRNASFVLIDRAVRRAARDTGRLPLGMAAMSFTLLRRDLFAVIFLGVSLTGIRALVPALVLAGIAIANLTLSAYPRELATAAQLEANGT